MRLLNRFTAAAAAVAMGLGTTVPSMANDNQQPDTTTQLSTPTGFNTGDVLPLDNPTVISNFAFLKPIARGKDTVTLRNMFGQTQTRVLGTTYILRNSDNGNWAYITQGTNGEFKVTQQGYDSESWMGRYNALLVADTKTNTPQTVCSVSDEFKSKNVLVFEGLSTTGSLLNIWTPERKTSEDVPGDWYKSEAVLGEKPSCKRTSGKEFQVAIPDYLKTPKHI